MTTRETYKIEIDKATAKMLEIMQKQLTGEKLELNTKLLNETVEGIKSDLDKLEDAQFKFGIAKTAKMFTKNIYGMTGGTFAAHGTTKHQIANSLSSLM